jgi:hypothetical protein
MIAVMLTETFAYRNRLDCVVLIDHYIMPTEHIYPTTQPTTINR